MARTKKKTPTKRARLRIGVAGWDYRDWRGVVYPHPRPRGFDPVRYLAGYIDCIEINSTFYRPPRPAVAEGWAERVADCRGFRFTAKLWRRFTHERDTSWKKAESKAEIDQAVGRRHRAHRLRPRARPQLFNNHYKGQSVVNALQFKKMLTRKKVEAPPTLMESYGEELEAAGVAAGE